MTNRFIKLFGKRYFFLFLVSAMAIGCAKNSIDSTLADDDTFVLTASAITATEPNTRMGYTENADRLSFTWENVSDSQKEQFSAFVQNVSNVPITFSLSQGDGTNDAIFKGNFSTQPEIGKKIHAIYPALPELKDGTTYNSQAIRLDLYAQTLATNTESLKHNKSHYMWSETTYEGGNDVAFKFKHKVAILKAIIKFPEGTKPIQTVKLSGQKCHAKLNTQSGILSFNDVLAGECTLNSTDIFGCQLNNQNKLTAYIYLFPQNLSGANNLTIQAIDFDGNIYEAKFNGRNVEAGNVYTLPVNLQFVGIPEQRKVVITKSAQSHIITMPGDIEALSFDYNSTPSGHRIDLEYLISDILPVNNMTLEAIFSENTTNAPIIYTIDILGKNRTTGAVQKYLYQIEHSTNDTPRKDGDVRVFIKSKLTPDKSYGVVYMADGFILEDLQQGKDYDMYANKALNYMFSKEPLATYRDYLNVYVMYVESKKRGLEGKLDTYYMSNGYPNVNQTIVKSYADKLPQYVYARIIGINHSDAALSGGLTISNLNAMFVVRSENIALHEFGHILGLGDEYQLDGYPGSGTSTKNYANLDITGDPTKVKWKHFIGLPGYEDVGTYEGGLYQLKGIWRPENLSMMKTYNKAFPEFNAPSRERIVQKIMEAAEIPYSFEEFLRLDKKTKQPKP